MFEWPTATELPALALAFTASVVAVLVLLGVFALVERHEPDPNRPAPRVFGFLTPVFAELLPSTNGGREAIRRDLLRAGFFEPVAPVNFRAVRSLLTYLPLLGGLVPAVLLEGPLSVAFGVVGIVGGLLGFALPRVTLSVLASGREEQVRRGLPMLMDTLGLSLSTGSNLPNALASSGHAIRRGYPELAREVAVVTSQGKLRSLAHALEAWRDRMPVPELGSFVYLLAQADRQGTDVTRGLWELSSSLQVNARQRAEAAANRVSFFMVFPSVLCLLLAAGLILAGPGIVQILDTNRAVEKILDEAQQNEGLIRQGQEGFLMPPSAVGGAGTVGPDTPASP
jgi:pilus assembly protein TadC